MTRFPVCARAVFLAAAAFAAAACDSGGGGAGGAGAGGGGGAAPGTAGGGAANSFEKMTAAGQCPVEVTGITRSMGPIPIFKATIRNLSDRPLSAIQWTVVFTGEGGKAVGEPSPGGYAGSENIEAEESIEGMFQSPGDEATGAKIVIREVVWMKANPLDAKLGELAMKWTNPRHDADVAAARGR